MCDFVILTDSCCDMTAQMAADLELEVLPLSLNMGDQVYHNYLDGREIGFQDFYAQLRAGALATTSAISVGVFEEAMGKILDSGRDVLYLAFSSALSTTYQSAMIAAQDLREAYPDRKIFVVDTLSASLGQGLLVYLCALEKRKGKTLEEVHAFAEETKGKIWHNGTTRNTTEVTLAGRGAEINLCGMVIADKNEQVDNHTFIDHKVADCTSNELFKYVLDDQATGAFAGKVLVREGAQHTNSQQTNRNLCATRDAHMYTQPQLEIYADDVKCSHGATVGQLDENALFYMQQRGISLKEARLLLMFAFVNEVIDTIRLDALKDRLHLLVEKRFRGELNKCQGCAICK